ncbi:SpaH/EbpB family LPXTG-anchored major pilin [Actinomycetaceae bacterium TAE3-ERU4]|nr:SpaH/EbpB family LPXTG-anchored major pilin [Actinomycetaceae bacterium TAE3-ERU4]
MTRNITRKAVAGLSVVTVALMGFGSTMALAVDGTPVEAISSITQDSGTLKIHKLTPSTDASHNTVNDGTEQTTPTGSKAIQGVKFTAMKVDGVDLKTNAGWEVAKKIADETASADDVLSRLDNQDNPTKVTVGGQQYNLVAQGGVQTTDTEGLATFSNLPVGLYLVYETVDGPVNIKDGEQGVPAERVNKAKPFFVTLPMTNPTDRTSWLYDLNIYPKNNLQTVPTKELNDNDNALGSGNDNTAAPKKSEILYTLGAKVPGVAELEHFELVDRFKTSQLEWIGTDTDVVKVGDDVLTKGSDFNFSAPQTEGEYTFVAMELTPEGMKKILKQQGKKVTWEMHAKVLDTTGPTEVPNDVFLNEVPKGQPGGKWTPKKPGTPGPGVKSYYGKVVINKKGQDAQALNGAEFQLFECDPSANYAKGRQVSVDNKDTWVSGTDGTKDGEIVIDGLLVNDFRNNSVTDTKDSKKWIEKTAYCLYETKAPAGYALLPNPITFQVTSTDGTAVPEEISLDVKNTKNHGGTPTLPVTGGAGIATLVGAGALLLAGSGAYAFAANRKRKQS